MGKEDFQQTRPWLGSSDLCSEGHRKGFRVWCGEGGAGGSTRALLSGAAEPNLCRAIWLWSALYQTDKLEVGDISQGSQRQVPERDLEENWNWLWLKGPGQPVYKMECQMMATHTHRPVHKDIGSVTLSLRHQV